MGVSKAKTGPQHQGYAEGTWGGGGGEIWLYFSGITHTLRVWVNWLKWLFHKGVHCYFFYSQLYHSYLQCQAHIRCSWMDEWMEVQLLITGAVFLQRMFWGAICIRPWLLVLKNVDSQAHPRLLNQSFRKMNTVRVIFFSDLTVSHCSAMASVFSQGLIS